MELLKSDSGHYYYTEGKGNPFIFLHGFPDCPENYKEQINFFSSKGYRGVIFIYVLRILRLWAKMSTGILTRDHRLPLNRRDTATRSPMAKTSLKIITGYVQLRNHRVLIRGRRFSGGVGRYGLRWGWVCGG